MTTEYTVVLRTPAAARFLPGEGQEINLPAGRQLPHQLRVRIFTRWEELGFESPVPRELVIEIRGQASSVETAIDHFSAVARPLVALLAFCANVATGRLEAHLAFDSTDGAEEREFLEVFLPDEVGSPTEGRLVDPDEFNQVLQAFLGNTQNPRLGRALQQYEIALRYWYFGGEYLALAHLYMAVETLTQAILKIEIQDRGICKEDLARSAGVSPDDPDRPKWSAALDAWCRKELIFAGDSTTYQLAKKASDGLEHGFLEFDEIYSKSVLAIEATFVYVRKAIARLLSLRLVDHETIIERRPRDYQSIRKMIRGKFLTPGRELALPGEDYPRLEWSSRIDKVTRSGRTINIQFKENFIVRCAPGVKFQGTSFEVRGRKDESIGGEIGRPAEDASSGAVLNVQYSEASTSWPQLMRRSRALASRVATHSVARGLSPTDAHTFSALSLQIALSESIEALLNDRRPVEALPLVRGLLESAARFEDFEDHPESPLAVSMGNRIATIERVSKLHDETGTPVSTAEGLAEITALGDQLGVRPKPPRELRLNEFHNSHETNVRFIREVESWGDLAASLHTDTSEGGLEFHTQIREPEIVQTAAGLSVIGLVYSSVIYAEVFAVSLDLDEATTLDSKARHIAQLG